MLVYLRTKFQISSIILTSFRQRGRGDGGNFTPTVKRTPKRPTLTRIDILVWCIYLKQPRLCVIDIEIYWRNILIHQKGLLFSSQRYILFFSLPADIIAQSQQAVFTCSNSTIEIQEQEDIYILGGAYQIKINHRNIK